MGNFLIYLATLNFIENRQTNMLKTRTSMWDQSHIAADFTFQYIFCFVKVFLCHLHISSANLQINEKKTYGPISVN